MDEFVVVGEYRRDNATRTVSRCSDYTATGCVFFVNRKRIHVYPVNHRHWIVGGFFGRQQLLTQRCRTAWYTQRPR
ncbi:Uncharacterised protein [Vibrio cholerae]|nr:Uncharacterised protein [Vibrio cholerae]CSD79842.1 Uncharacterised protein [Vibrio cholerae]CSI59121.1 Uncharacterised protein [Vibrio cholerae]